MAEMTVAVFEVVSTCSARIGFVRNTHALIERSIRNNCSGLIQVEKLSVRNFHYCLADNVIVGSGNISLY
jgi:hypothetical protein